MDVYDGTPTIVTVWLTIVVKLTILIFLLGLIELNDPWLFGTSFLENQQTYVQSVKGWGDSAVSLACATQNVAGSWLHATIGGFGLPSALASQGQEQIKNLLLISSLLSLLIGTIAGLSQIKVKRLLAFSSISHVGFLLLALGIYTQKSVDSFIFYLVQYSITSLNIFLILLAFGYLLYPSTYNVQKKTPTSPSLSKAEEADINYLIELKGQLYKNPVLSVSLAICLFSMAGKI